MAQLHFTLGEDLGIQLAEIAKEHVQNLRLDKAIDTFVGSFGCPEDMARQLVAGHLVVVVNDPEKCLIDVTERSSLKPNRQKKYPQLTAEKIHRLVDKYFQDPYDEDEGHVFEHFRLEMSTVNRILAGNYELYLDAELTSMFIDMFPEWFPKGVKIEGNISILPRVIFKDVVDHNGEDSEFMQFLNEADICRLSKYNDSYKMFKVMWIVKHMLEILKHKDQILELEDFAIEQYGCDTFHKYITERNIESVEEIFGNWLMFSDNVQSKLAVRDEDDKPEDELDKYMKGIDNIDKMSKNFGPVDITKGYDAGWLAPDGKYFGLNGSSGNFLHINIADELMEYYHFEKPKDFDFSVDAFIAKQGFVKIHHDWVLYEGYDCVMTDKPVPLTKKQKDAIVKYGNKVYGGKLLFGYYKKKVTMEDFKNMNEEQLEDLLAV